MLEVISDVRGARVWRPDVNLPRTLDALQGEQQLAVPGRRREVLYRVPVPISTTEVHPAVDPRRIALQDLLDEADPFEELAPVERRNQAQAADQIGHRRLFGRLMLAFRANRVLDRLFPCGQRLVEPPMERRGRGAVRARALQQARHECVVRLFRPLVRALRLGLECGRHPIRRLPVGPGSGEPVGSHAQVVEQRELERARPGPELPHRERRDRLKRADEPLQPLRFDSARARSDQLEGERIDARQARELLGRDAGQASEKGRRQVVVDVAGGGGDDVEIVEQPLGRRRHRLLPRVVCERRVDAAQRAHVVVQLTEMGASAAATARRNRD